MDLISIIYFLLLLLISIFSIIFLIRLKNINEKIRVGSSQILGERNDQEDNYSVIKSDDGLLAVLADGMGGLLNGKLASKLAVDTFLEEFVKDYRLKDVEKFFINTSYIANEKILKKGIDSKMGTTLVSCFIEKDNFYWVSIGDSHIYLYRNKELKKLNNDHIYGRILLSKYKKGIITRTEYFSNPKRERLTSYLGYKNFNEIDYNENGIEMLKGDKIILCSDGVYKNLREDEFVNFINQKIHPKLLTQEIMIEIEQKNISGLDNSTIILIEKK